MISATVKVVVATVIARTHLPDFLFNMQAEMKEKSLAKNLDAKAQEGKTFSSSAISDRGKQFSSLVT